MCGLVGIFGAGSTKMDNLFLHLLHIDAIRGKDSTGVAFISKKGKPEVLKEVGMPSTLMNHKQFPQLLRRKNLCLLGHNRAATKGEVTRDNAHPFVHAPIVGTHNGTLTSTFTLADAKDFGTDSEAIMWNLALNGADETYTNLRGAAALVWWDIKEKTLNMVTNGDRPLFFALTKDGKSLVWASEGWMLRGVFEKHGLEMQNGVRRPKKDWLLSFSYKNGVISNESRQLEPFVAPVTNTYGNGGRPTTPNHGTQQRPISSKWNTGNKRSGIVLGPKATKKSNEEVQKELDQVFKNHSPRTEQVYDSNLGKMVERIVPARSMVPITNDNRKGDVKPTAQTFPAGRVRNPGLILPPDVVPSVDKSQNFREGPRGITISEDDFEKHYSSCKGCGQGLDFVDTSIDFVDINLPLCEECSTTARTHGISAHSIH